jgi:hypothetical protein
MTPEQRELIDEGRKFELSLSNGHRGDPGTMSDALGYLIRSQRILLHADMVSDKECKTRMSNCPGSRPVVQKPTFSRAQAVAWLGSVLMGCATLLSAIHLVVTK